MDKDRTEITRRILDFTLEIIYLLSGEEYSLVKKTSGDCVALSSRGPNTEPGGGGSRSRGPITEPGGGGSRSRGPNTESGGGGSRSRGPITAPPPLSLIHEQKILELTNKMLELLTGEVPIRCQDVAVYFSMEEWEYLEGHEDRYKEEMMEDPRPLLSGERGRGSLRPLKGSGGNVCVPQDYQGKDLHNVPDPALMIKEEPGADEAFMADEPTGDCPDDYTNGSEGHLISSDLKADDITQDPYHERVIVTDLSLDPLNQVLSPDSSQAVELNNGHSSPVGHPRAHRGEKPFSCSECGKCFALRTTLCVHELSHAEEKQFSYLESGNTDFVRHWSSHTGEKPYSCSECGKHFTVKSSLVRHQRIHTGAKPFSCPECGKCFNLKSNLVAHQKIHTGEKSYSCLECGKCFTVKSSLVRHQRVHTGLKSGNIFYLKSNLVEHQRIHTGEELY
ncbi:gastrula zinc finger protein XlCGF66.1-like [Leptodactylus fuscus]|uniref:gastrula zinc finger protein XlCGF66.1-like n=1 Tax=Leptodactylus fuscus TaxID=238119 RepID=UPI003F4E7F8A